MCRRWTAGVDLGEEQLTEWLCLRIVGEIKALRADTFVKRKKQKGKRGKEKKKDEKRKEKKRSKHAESTRSFSLSPG